MKALEYEAVNQTDHEDATDPAGQSTKKRHRTLLWTAMTNGPPMIQRQSQNSYAAVLLISTLVVILISMHGHRTGKDDPHKTGMLRVTPELIQSEHGTISSAFFAPSSPEDTTCPDATLEISKNNHVYGCISDRLQNNEVLGRGTVLCSEGGRYSFGFAKVLMLLYGETVEMVQSVNIIAARVPKIVHLFCQKMVPLPSQKGIYPKTIWAKLFTRN